VSDELEQAGNVASETKIDFATMSLEDQELISLFSVPREVVFELYPPLALLFASFKKMGVEADISSTLRVTIWDCAGDYGDASDEAE
jgi:hypothetical protein